MSVEKQRDIPRGAEEPEFIAQDLSLIQALDRQKVEPIARHPLRRQQWELICDVLQEEFPTADVSPEDRKDNIARRKTYLSECIQFPGNIRVSRGRLLMEWASFMLARHKGDYEYTLNRQGELRFAIPGIGAEALHIAVERNLRHTDARIPYYRHDAGDIVSGGTVRALLAMDSQRAEDPHTGGKNLAGHPSNPARGSFSVISNVAAQMLPGAGIAQGIKLRSLLETDINTWQHFASADAIAVIHIGDASMAQGEAKEAFDELLIRGGAPGLVIIHNNGSGISTDSAEGSVGRDPIAGIRGLKTHGLEIYDVDATDIDQLFQTTRDATEYVRTTRKPAVIHAYNLHKRTHSSSDDPRAYMPDDKLALLKKHDPLPLFRQYLLASDSAYDHILDEIGRRAEIHVKEAWKDLKHAPAVTPETLYHDVYSSISTYSSTSLTEEASYLGNRIDVLSPTRQDHIQYLTSYREGPIISFRQHITAVIAQEMKRDDRILYTGEDIADFSADVIARLPDLLEQRLAEHAENIGADAAMSAMASIDLVRRGEGHRLDPDDFAFIAHLLGGKGGVFKVSHYLQMLFGSKRVYNSRLAEASIIGTSIGLARSGFVPIAEMQFGAYITPAYTQLKEQLATLKWRSGGNDTAGMVIIINSQSRLNGVGGPGHGEVITGEIARIPGLRHVFPGHASEAGPLMREAIRMARENHEPVVYVVPINLVNGSTGPYQGHDSYIPIGESEILTHGDESLLVLTYSNNVPVVLKANEKWKSEGIHPTIVNLRTMGVQTDWNTLQPLIQSHSKVMIVESERSAISAGAGLSAAIGEQLFQYLDGPITRVAARNLRTPAGELSERFVLPQEDDVYQAGTHLDNY